ncbi:MAG: hypothetical protein LBM41_06210 [Ruminococcus sp.]|nr:hypothetical protein [Ruminococcus sp.]
MIVIVAERVAVVFDYPNIPLALTEATVSAVTLIQTQTFAQFTKIDL